MNERQFKLLAGKRLFMYNMKLYFPEYVNKPLDAAKFPFDGERYKGHMSMAQYLDKKPFGLRLFILLEVLDEREIGYLINGKKPLPLFEETESVLAECERRMSDKASAKIIEFPSFGGRPQPFSDS